MPKRSTTALILIHLVKFLMFEWESKFCPITVSPNGIDIVDSYNRTLLILRNMLFLKIGISH